MRLGGGGGGAHQILKAYKVINLQSNGILELVECYVDLQELLNRQYL